MSSVFPTTTSGIDASPPPMTLFERLWSEHLIDELGGGVSLLQVDRHVLQEVSSAAAFQSLRSSGRKVIAPAQTFATQDHILSTLPGRDEATYPQGVEF